MNYYRKTVGFLASSRIGRVMMLGIVAMLAFSLLADAANQRRGARVKSIVVESAASSEKAITAFSFAGLTPSVTGTIDQTNHTVALTVPYGTTVTDLVSTFTVSDGATVKVGSTSQTSGTTANNFISPKTYTVTAADGTTQDYTVTVTNAQNPAKAITAFTITGQQGTTTIDESAKTIAVTMPYGTDLTTLSPTVTITGSSVSPTSGTANNFISPKTYTVTAADGTTQAYTVTVTANTSLTIGVAYGGGIVAYILQAEDPGYEANVPHGLIAATADASSGIIWAVAEYQSTSVSETGTAIGTGSANTDKIIAQNEAGTTYAAGLARAYNGGGYTDWYLPSKDELNQLYANRAAVGGFGANGYWSSSEYTADYAWGQGFDGGCQVVNLKNGNCRVRPVRAF
ncbi:DUF1566 domain-containing protein [Chlorobium phaeovibrioides]|uniref:DUF1566 domain-containing protein n=1 Tax=Chlorobium phaeovibrioides TaxID=1094 RepID=A0A432AXH0_CHLPH|nr:DUF1566 domain-containing protein [Chlorobium phaeovibrioides]RTY39571.1 DUF1566 domain-containing protein [Chlorobium phaeovibrioides]